MIEIQPIEDDGVVVILLADDWARVLQELDLQREALDRARSRSAAWKTAATEYRAWYRIADEDGQVWFQVAQGQAAGLQVRFDRDRWLEEQRVGRGVLFYLRYVWVTLKGWVTGRDKVDYS